MIVVFSHKMKSEFVDVQWLNGTIMDLYLVPANNRDQDEGFELSSLNFTWNVTKYGVWEGQKDPVVSMMAFKVIFQEPLSISPLKI